MVVVDRSPSDARLAFCTAVGEPPSSWAGQRGHQRAISRGLNDLVKMEAIGDEWAVSD